MAYHILVGDDKCHIGNDLVIVVSEFKYPAPSFFSMTPFGCRTLFGMMTLPVVDVRRNDNERCRDGDWTRKRLT